MIYEGKVESRAPTVRVFKNDFIRIHAQWRMPSGSNDLPGKLPRGNEIRSIILYNAVPRTVRKLFDLHKSERRLVSCRRDCLYAHSKCVAAMFFSSSTNLPSHGLSLAQPRRSLRRSLLYDIVHLPRAKQIHRPSGCTVRMTPTWTSTRAGIRDIWTGQRASLRDLKRRSITWIVNPTGRWTYSRPFAARHNENFNTLAQLGRPLCTMPKGIASMWMVYTDTVRPLLSFSLSLSHHYCDILNSSDKQHRVTCLARVAAPILKSQPTEIIADKVMSLLEVRSEVEDILPRCYSW